jgi:hypothetical protein
MPDVEYLCENWFPTLTDEHRLKVFEKRVLRRIFGSKTEEVIGGRQNLLNKNLHNCYCTSNIIWLLNQGR